MTALAQAPHPADQRGREKPRKAAPHNAQAEASILGGILAHNEALGWIDTLETADFYEHKHRVVFEAIRNLETRRVPIDLATLEAEIDRAGKLEAIGGPAFLGEIALAVGTPENVAHYAKIVRDQALVRRVLVKSSELAERAQGWEYEADELVGEAIADFQQLERGYREASDAIPIITIDSALDERDRLAQTPIFETPFPELNRALGFGGLLAGQVYYLAGGTGFGKTSFIGNIVRAYAEPGFWALIAFYEMFSAYYVARMAAGPLGIHANRILRGDVDRETVRRALPSTIEMLDSPSMTVLRRAAERHVRAGHGAPLIVVDYVQLLGDRILASMSRPDPRLANAQASAGLRELAKATGAAVIAVSAAGRSASKKLAADVRKQPARDLIDAARESGAIEFDGAGVIVLSVSADKDGDEDVATISVAKARFGETTHIDARYDGRTGAWREIGRVATVPKITPKPDDGSLRAAIVTVLEKHGPLSKTKIAAFSGRNKTAVLSEIDAMMQPDVSALVYVQNRIGLPKHLGVGPALAAQIAMAVADSEAGSGPVPEGES